MYKISIILMLLLMMFQEIIRLVYEITIELYALCKVSKNNEISNCRLKLFKKIKEIMVQHKENMKGISSIHKQLDDAHELEVKNKESEKTEQLHVQHIINYISYRNANNITDNDLKLMYNNNINNLIEKLRNAYTKINKLNNYYNNISRAHSTAVHHAVLQAVKQDKIRIQNYNQMQFEKKCIIDELTRICKLEQAHIMQVNNFNYQIDYQQTAYQQTAYQQTDYQQTDYHQTDYLQTPYQKTRSNDITHFQTTNEELELEQEQEQEKEQEQEHIITCKLYALDID